MKAKEFVQWVYPVCVCTPSLKLDGTTEYFISATVKNKVKQFPFAATKSKAWTVAKKEITKALDGIFK